MALSDGGEEERIPGWASVQVGGVAVVKPAHERSVPSPSRRLCLSCVRPITLLMRRSGSGAEVAGGRGIHDGALGGWVNAVQELLLARGLRLPSVIVSGAQG